MQMYPRGYKEEHHHSAADYRYEDSSYNGMHMNMMKVNHSQPKHGQIPNHCGDSYGYGGYNNHDKKNENSSGYGGYNNHEKKNENSYGYGGYNNHEKKNGNSYGYGGYNSHEKKEHESYVAMQSWQEEERRQDSWSINKHDQYSAHGGKMPYHGEFHIEGVKHGAHQGHTGHYGPHQGHTGHYGPHYPQETKKVHVWEFKGIVD